MAESKDVAAELDKPSLLDTVQRRFQDEGGRESVTRLMYIGLIPKGSSLKSVCQYHETFLKDIDADVSGLMILQQDSFLNLIEAAPDAIMALMRHINKQREETSPCLTSVRVLASSEDCPSRAFVSWSYRSVSLKAEPKVDLDGDDVAGVAYEVYSKLVALGKELTNQDLTHADISAALDTLRQRYADYIPTNERIKAIVALDGIPKLEEYMEIFDAPVDVDLESELVWPHPPSLKY